MYSLNANKVGVATDNLRTFSDINSTVYNGFELSANMRRDKLLLFGGITTDRAPRPMRRLDHRDDHGATTRTARRFCDSTPPFRTTYKMSAAYQLPWEFQLSGSFIATPGPSVNANYTVTAAIAGRPIVGSHRRRHDDHGQPGRAEHRVPRLQEAARPAPRRATSASARAASRASPTSSTC